MNLERKDKMDKMNKRDYEDILEENIKLNAIINKSYNDIHRLELLIDELESKKVDYEIAIAMALESKEKYDKARKRIAEIEKNIGQILSED
jgi:hypothetical protein